MRVLKGTVTEDGGRERPCVWVETRLTLEVEGRDLLGALGSRYFRHEPQRDDERPERLPMALTPHQMLKICREELRHCGESTLWTWTDGLSEGRQHHVDTWLEELVVGAFPEMKGHL